MLMDNGYSIVYYSSDCSVFFLFQKLKTTKQNINQNWEEREREEIFLHVSENIF